MVRMSDAYKPLNSTYQPYVSTILSVFYKKFKLSLATVIWDYTTQNGLVTTEVSTAEQKDGLIISNGFELLVANTCLKYSYLG